MLNAIILAIKKEVAMTKSVLQKEKLITFCVINNIEILNFKRDIPSVNQKADPSIIRNELKLYYYYYYYYYHNIQEDIEKMAGTNNDVYQVSVDYCQAHDSTDTTRLNNVLYELLIPT
jgi:hypothetical protein